LARMPTFSSRAPLARVALRCQPDARLVLLAREGNDSAFEEIVRRYRAPLVAFAGAIVPTHRAEDVVQEVLAKAHAALPGTDGLLKLKPWLYTIVRNRALNDLRDERAHEQLHENIDGVPQPPEIAARREELGHLVARVKALPEAQREALVQRELEGRSHEEIATAIGATPGAVRALIFRARTTLRNGVGVLIPIPVLRALLSGSLQTDAGGAGLGAAGLTAGGGGIALKAGGALAVGALAVGSGLVLHHGRSHDATSQALASHQPRHHGARVRHEASGGSAHGAVDGSRFQAVSSRSGPGETSGPGDGSLTGTSGSDGSGGGPGPNGGSGGGSGDSSGSGGARDFSSGGHDGHSGGGGDSVSGGGGSGTSGTDDSSTSGDDGAPTSSDDGSIPDDSSSDGGDVTTTSSSSSGSSSGSGGTTTTLDKSGDTSLGDG
jgi:RNA polymerase sigma factor (sigma-70 family)